MAGKPKNAKQSFDQKWIFVPSGCWEWLSADPGTYGHFTMRGMGYRNQMNAHRASWILHNGAVPNGLFVLHKCDNKRCVNPEHLFLGTQADNMNDMSRKGRSYRGVRVRMFGADNPASRLTAEKAFDIRWRVASGFDRHKVAEEFNTSYSNINRIVRNELWRAEVHD